MALFSQSNFIYAWNTYHLLDWLVLAALSIVAGIVTARVQPYCRTFSWNDATIAYPAHADTFPNYTLVLMIVFALGFYVVFVLQLVKPLQRLVGEPMSCYALGGDSGSDAYADLDAQDGNSKRMRIRDMQTGRGPLYPWIRAQLWAVGLDFFVMASLKVYAGRLRPDYLARLKAAGYTSSMKLPDPQTDPTYYCKLMDDHPALHEGRLSFPSGHSSTSFAVFTVMTYFLVAYLRPFARQASFTRLLICLCPLLVSTTCAVSRTRDNKHHFSDILAGSLIGITCATLSFCGSFRHVGGAAGIYFGRSASDVEYEQLREPQGRGGSSGSAAAVPSFGTADGGSKAMAGGAAAAAAGAAMAGGGAGEFGSVQAREDSEMHRSGSPTLRRGSDTTVLVMDVQRGWSALTERRLNEDPAAVPWI